jgi:hypothetical protein
MPAARLLWCSGWLLPGLSAHIELGEGQLKQVPSLMQVVPGAAA